ncbi:MAG: cytochrome ubiquinol oxidase subunit I [Verrucomicrobia bacterium]|nr:cytochrome ubiquinol oxidase subunit I [Verrucomicrobiota bacterium]
MNVEILARAQFALTVMFHYLFPPLTIGLGGLLVLMEWRYLRTGDPLYESLTKFWTKIFALNFALGVATGIVMEFQFGTNWASYSRYVGDIFGSALAAEGIFAFFLESVFLGVMIFGWNKVSKRMHFFSTCMVALGAVLSSVWIIVANSWQQTPAGFVIRNGRAELTDFAAAVFNPSTVHRLVHVWIGAYILAAFFVMGVSAWYILKNRHVEAAKTSFRLALVMGLVASLLAPLSGDGHGRNVAQYQPAKMAAMEGHFVTGTGATPIYLFGFPDVKSQTVKGGVAIPGLLSFLVHRDFKTPVTGLDKFPRADWPPVALTFQTFHAMVALGLLFILLTVAALFWRWRGTLFEKRWLLWVFVLAVPLPYLANQLGWVAAEVGRQPWVVYGLLRTGDALSKSVTAGQVLGSIIMFGVIYALLFAVWLYILLDKIRQGPEPVNGGAQ